MYWFTNPRRLSILTRAGHTPPCRRGVPSADLTSSPFALGSPSLLEEFFSETQTSEEGPGVFTVRESQKRSPGPSPTTYPPPKELRLQFYTFVLRGRTLSSGKAEERSFFYVGSSRNGAERHVGPEL